MSTRARRVSRPAWARLRAWWPTGEEIYNRRLRFAEAEARIRAAYRPYHEALRTLLEQTRRIFVWCILLDCYSMPSPASLPEPDRRQAPDVDAVLGECHGRACAPVVTATAERVLKRLVYTVQRNLPYAGGYTTRHYGRPRAGIHALQIEINRAISMDESTLEKRPRFVILAEHMAELIAALGALPPVSVEGR